MKIQENFTIYIPKNFKIFNKIQNSKIPELQKLLIQNIPFEIFNLKTYFFRIFGDFSEHLINYFFEKMILRFLKIPEFLVKKFSSIQRYTTHVTIRIWCLCNSKNLWKVIFDTMIFVCKLVILDGKSALYRNDSSSERVLS